MPRIRYHVAVSLDGYIAGPNGEYDWIVREPGIEFNAPFALLNVYPSGIVWLEYDIQRLAA